MNTKDYKFQLVEKLTELRSLDSFDPRTNLLDGMPGKDLIRREPSNTSEDLVRIFDFALVIGRTAEGIPALEIVHRNIMRYVPAGTELAAGYPPG